MRRWSNDRTPCAFDKQELYNPQTDIGMIADIDGWIDGRQGLTASDTVGFNGCFNASYRNKPSADQKTDMFLAVAAMRRGINYIQRIFGETE